MFSIVTLKKYCFKANWKYFHIQNQLKLRQVYYGCVFSQFLYVEFCESFGLSSSSDLQFFPCPSQCTSINFKLCIWNKTSWNPANYLSFVCTLWYIQGIFRCIVFSIMSVEEISKSCCVKIFWTAKFSSDVCVSFFINFVYWPLTSARNGDVTVGDLRQQTLWMNPNFGLSVTVNTRNLTFTDISVLLLYFSFFTQLYSVVYIRCVKGDVNSV